MKKKNFQQERQSSKRFDRIKTLLRSDLQKYEYR